MGFFDKLKQVKNMVTGGGATVTITPENTVNKKGEPLKLKVNAVIKDGDLKASKIYVYVRAIEKIVARNVEVASGGSSRRQDVKEEAETYRTEVTVDGAQTLAAGQTYDWNCEVNLPDNIHGTYRGKNAWHEWQVYAGLDVTGNDPDSGWVNIEVH